MPGIDLVPPRLRMRRTRIVATLGPASASPARIRELIAAGVDVFRLNFSHGDAAWHTAVARRVRTAARSMGDHVAILGDLSGPKIRVGRFAGGAIVLEPGAPVVVTTRPVEGHPGLIPSQYPALARDVKPGETLLLDDGNLELRVVRARGTEITCRVVRGGRLSDHKGLNLPGSTLSAASLTAKDRRDAALAVALGLDYLALSFVRRASDVLALRALLRRRGAVLPIIAKIEKPQALAEIDAILEAASAIMVARGDLGVELPPEQVPVVQRELIRRARAADRPVIVATQMLESMIDSPRPTRAEANDVATAVYSSADAVMLSAETASGAWPVEAVRMMDRIIRTAEGSLWRAGAFDQGATDAPAHGGAVRPAPTRALTAIAAEEGVVRAAARLSWELQVRCLVVPTRTGASARAVAAARPEAPVLAVCNDDATCRRLRLLWGVHAVRAVLPAGEAIDRAAVELARTLGWVRRGDPVLVLRGFDPDPARSRPTLVALRVP